MSKNEFIQILDAAFSEGTPFIDYTEHYSYIIVPKGDKWLEVSYDFEDHEILENRTLDPVEAFHNFCEEVEKSLSILVEIFYLNKWKEFKETLTGSEGEKLLKLIAEITQNSATYGNDLPIITKAENLETLKAKL